MRQDGGNREARARYKIPLSMFAAFALIFGALVVLYAVNAKLFLPPNYYLDEAIFANNQHIIMPCAPLSGVRDAFICTSNVYKSLGIDQATAPWISGLLVASLFFLVPVYFGRRTFRPRGVSPAFMVLTIVWAFVAASFNSGLSKELLALFALLFATSFAVRSKYALALFVFLVYAVFIRTYWVLLIPGTLFVWFVMAKMTFNKAILASIGMAVIISIAYNLLLGSTMESIRAGTNEARSYESASEITAMLPDTNFALGAANTVLIWISLVLPFKLLLLGSPQHVIVALIVAATMCVLYGAGQRLRRTGDHIGQFCLSVLICFIAIQALFEPDYGSFVRHISDFMPFGLIAIFRSYVPKARE